MDHAKQYRIDLVQVGVKSPPERKRYRKKYRFFSGNGQRHAKKGTAPLTGQFPPNP
jgi:hypothetical protein